MPREMISAAGPQATAGFEQKPDAISCIMKTLYFLSRLAFICNLCFLAALLFQTMPHAPEGEIISTVIILGYVVAIVLNVVVNIWYVFLLISHKSFRQFIPVWLVAMNFLFLIPQLIIFL